MSATRKLVFVLSLLIASSCTDVLAKSSSPSTLTDSSITGLQRQLDQLEHIAARQHVALSNARNELETIKQQQQQQQQQQPNGDEDVGSVTADIDSAATDFDWCHQWNNQHDCRNYAACSWVLGTWCRGNAIKNWWHGNPH